MPPVVWTTNALAGLRRLYAFLAEKDRAAVRRAMGFMYDKARLLGDYPNAAGQQRSWSRSTGSCSLRSVPRGMCCSTATTMTPE